MQCQASTLISNVGGVGLAAEALQAALEYAVPTRTPAVVLQHVETDDQRSILARAVDL
jgi:hypothetical protein